MASIEEYCNSQPTEKLKAALRAHANGEIEYPEDIVLLICGILAERAPSKPDVAKAYHRFLKYYAPKETNNDL